MTLLVPIQVSLTPQRSQLPKCHGLETFLNWTDVSVRALMAFMTLPIFSQADQRERSSRSIWAQLVAARTTFLDVIFHWQGPSD